MFRSFSLSCIYVVSFATFTLCKPAELENTCDVRSKSYLLASVIRYATGDRSPSCLPAFSFFDEWGVYGSTAKIDSIVSYNNQIIVGGNFSSIGFPTGSAAFVDAQTGAVVPNRFCPFLKVKGITYVAISDGSGGFYIGGDFTHVQGTARSQVARILPGCQLDSNFIPDTSTSRIVTALAILGDQLYVGGQFVNWGTGSQVNIVSLNRESGKLNTNFYTGTIDADVLDIVTDGSSLFIGGNFQNIAAGVRYGVAKISPNTGVVDTSFTGQVQAGGTVNDLHLGTDTSGNPVLYAVGFFSGAKPNAKSFYLNGVETSWAPSTNFTVNSVSQYENTIYLGGEFTTVKTVTPANYLVGVDNNTGNVIQNNFGISGNVTSATVIGNKLYALGEFAEAKGQTRNFAAGYDLPNHNLNDWNPSFLDSIFTPVGSVVAAGSTVMVVSNNQAVNLKPYKHFVVIDDSTGSPIGGTPNFDFPIKSLHIKNNHLFVGGSFEHVNGIPRIALAILDLPTYQLNQANLNILPAGSETRTITSNDTQIFFGGAGMSSVNGQTRNALASINAENFSLTNWFPNLGGSATSLLVLNDAVYIGGIYISLNGDNSIANYRAVDTNTGLVLPLPSTSDYPNSDVAAQTYFDGKIYLGGIFSMIGASTFNNFAMYDTNTKSYISPNPIYANGHVYSITPSPDGKIVVAGSFTGLNGSTTNNYLSAFDSKTNTVLPWFPNMDNTGFKSIYLNGKWYIGGEFKNAFNKPYGGFFTSDLTEK
ncbi:hypothetical protein EHQ24_16265 [Leptospira noumeaensis]|uniref:Galactose oxidase n=1 Tax=Leptospira noumeaensis TaxID=2484964 RepID=A0A4V3JJ87_9LEPT|nr:delta-60 repeat domain-containing protein [Leptospira noumeaensis]TGK79100.1 hypothetical protein EHQ24_16265 [Leptospira noumeaensis]